MILGVSRLAGRLAVFALGILVLGVVNTERAAAQTSPSTYSAYTGTDPKVIPRAPAFGPANSVINDPTFGSRILRVTDANSAAERSLIPTDSGFVRTWNANSTAIKLVDATGDGFWLEFDPSTFRIGDGSSRPVPNPLPFDYRWVWSAVNPDVIYYLNGNQLGKYNKSTGASTSLGGPPNGHPVMYHATVVGADNWVCSAAGAGIQDTYTEIFCVDPNNTANTKFIDVVNKTINGARQSDPKWPTSAAGVTIGIHSMYGSAGGAWLGVTFHQQSWGANGDAVLDLATNTWSLLTNGDIYWAGHVSLGNGKFVNGSGSTDGRDSRGAIVRDPDDLMNSSKRLFIMQPSPSVNWTTGEHNSWFNSASNPRAPVLFSRYGVPSSPPLTWEGEIIAAAVDGSNTVWRFAHHHGAASTFTYYQSAFAQISNDGHWALFSSYWDGTLGASSGDFGVPTRIDTFIVDLGAGGQTPPDSPSSGSGTPSGGTGPSGGTSSGDTSSAGDTPSSPTTIRPQEVVWANTVNVEVRRNTIIKKFGCDGCGDAGGSSTQGIATGDGYLEFRAVTGPLAFVGLTNGSTTDPGGARFTFRFQGNDASVYEFGTWKADTVFGTGDIFRIAIDNGIVKYTKNGTLVYTSTLQPTYPLRAYATLAGLGAAVDGAVIGLPSTTTTSTNGGTDSSGGPPSGPTTIRPQKVVWANTVNVDVRRNTIVKKFGCDGCGDAGGSSTQGIATGDGYLEFRVVTGPLAFVGLTDGSATDPGGARFTFRFQGNDASVYEFGTWKADTVFGTGDIFRIAIDNGTVTYTKNGTPVYTSTLQPTYPLRAYATLAGMGATVTNAVVLGQ
jgi:hypothetical protein